MTEDFLRLYTAARFWEKFERRGECLRYASGARRKRDGSLSYAPKISWMGRSMYVVRVAAMYGGLLDYVDQPGYIRHTCGDAACFNPTHLAVSPTRSRAKAPPKGEKEFWALLDKSGPGADPCWHYHKKSIQKAHPVVMWNGRVQRVSRLAAVYGKIISPTGPPTMIKHACGDPLCFKPSHLYVITVKQRFRRFNPEPPHQPTLFWSKVDRTGECWVWRGKRPPHMRIRYDGGTHTPMQIAQHLSPHKYPLDHEREWVHECGNARCIRPDHLI